MKKLISILLLLVLSLGVFVFVGCEKPEEPVEKLTVKFAPLNDATIADLEIEASTESVTLPTPTRQGQVFKGWFFDEDYTTEVTLAGLKEKLKDGTITVYAKWEAEPAAPARLTVHFDTKGGAAVPDAVIEATTAYTLPTTAKENNDFRGWYFEENYATVVTVDALKAKIADGSVTVYAKWEEVAPPVARLTVHFDPKGGAAVTDAVIEAETSYALPTTTKDHNDFRGWYFEENYATAVTVDALKGKISEGSVTIYAKWDEHAVTLQFNGNGADPIADQPVKYSALSGLVLPTPEKANNRFLGWYFDAAFATACTAAGVSERFEKGATIQVYAKWGEIVSGETVTMRGAVADKYVLNPVFEWTDPKGDAKFLFVIKDAEGAVAVSEEVTGTRCVLANNLAYGKTYTLEITGVTSCCYRTLTFETVAGTGEVNMNNAVLALAEPFKSHMVIQRGKAININGMTAAGALVAIDFYGETSYAVANGSGLFTFAFPAREADATPDDITFTVLRGKTLVIEDVLVGDVYLASGQSNMQWQLKDSDSTMEDRTNAALSDVRFFAQSTSTSSTPRDTVSNGKWFKVADAADETAYNAYKQYSAIAFMTGSMLGKALMDAGVPVGVVYAAQGDTNIVNWMGKEYYDGPTATKNLHYNAMIYPLRTAEFSGVIWYQGCNNAGKGSEYEALLGTLFANWRALFRNDSLPFYVVQLPCYDGSSGNNYDFSYVRESQLKACEADEHAYLIATCDGGDPTYIHPTEKRYICERLTKSILATVYGEDYLPQGPTYRSFDVDGSSAVITVNNGDGLTADGEIVGFMLAGADGKYFDATATISEGKIVVTSTNVATPSYVKYGFSKSPFLNIYNKDGFLMSPFRTDDHNHNIDLLDYRESAVYTSNPGGAAMQTAVVDVDGEVGLQVTKANTSAYGILELTKWGAIGYDEHVLKLRLKGSNSGAKLVFRIVEGSYETWATPALTDNFDTAQNFEIPFAAFRVSDNANNGIIDLQSVMRVELVIKELSAEATVTVLGAKFVDYTRTVPSSFTITEAKNDGNECSVKYSASEFATSYDIIVSADSENYSDPIYRISTEWLQTSFPASLCEENTTYFVKVVARNELGETVATNSGLDFSTFDRVSVAKFTFADDATFNEYVSAKISNVNSNLILSRSEKGLKVNVHGKVGWMDFIIKMDTGINVGYDTMRIYLDLTEYKGESLKIQLHDQSYNSFTATVNTSSKKEGYFEIPLSSFTNSSLGAFDGRAAIRIKVGVTDYAGGDSDNLYLNDIDFIKVSA